MADPSEMPTDATPTGHREPVTELSRDLRVFDITMVGVGAMIGAGIFALTGIAAGEAGPALILAFCLNGVLTLCTAMVYAEIGSAIPGAGGGYLWVKHGLPGPTAFLAGWMDWLAHAVAGSLYAVIFGAYVVWGLQTIFGWGIAPTGEGGHGDMGTLFGVNAIWFAKALTLFICIAFCYINYRGSSETGKAGNIITVSKVITIVIFIGFGLVAILRGGASGETLSDATMGEKFAPFLPAGMGGVVVAMGLTFIAFEGYEIIVQAGEEVENPRRNIPRAIFWSLAIVIPIYVLVAIVCLGAMNIPQAVLAAHDEWTSGSTWEYLAALGETGVAEAANQFMPWITGAILLVIGAILSTMSALNATTYSSTRVCFAMGRDRYLPAAMAHISPTTRVPSVALISSAVIITGVALFLDAEQVAAATCVMFLLVFLLVNLSAIMIRRKYGNKLRYGYVMPLFPLVPIVAIIGQVGVVVFLLWHEPLSLWISLGWIGAGLIIYYLYSVKQEHWFRATPVVLEQKPAVSEGKTPVLIPIANPANARPLIELGRRIADPDNGGLLLLHVVLIPEQLPYDAATPFVNQAKPMLDEALQQAEQVEAVSEGLLRVSHHVGRSIVETIMERRVGTLIMGWAGPRRGRRDFRSPGGRGLRRPVTLIGSEIDHVISSADADTIVLRGRLPESPGRILIPIANPRQGLYAIQVAEAVAGEETKIDLITVVPTRDHAKAHGEALMEGLFGDPALVTKSPRRGLPVALEVVARQNVVQAIFEASRGHDLIIVGATTDSWWQRRVFTRFHYELASRYPGPLLLVKLRTGRAKFTSQKLVEFFTSKDPQP